MRAVKQFFDWCDERHLKLTDIEAISVATYIEQLGTQASKPTVKQPLAAIRPLLIISLRAAFRTSTRRLRCADHVGQTRQGPVLSSEEAPKLLDSIAIPLSATTTGTITLVLDVVQSRIIFMPLGEPRLCGLIPWEASEPAP